MRDRSFKKTGRTVSAGHTYPRRACADYHQVKKVLRRVRGGVVQRGITRSLCSGALEAETWWAERLCSGVVQYLTKLSLD
jgi:hypothetical protein